MLHDALSSSNTESTSQSSPLLASSTAIDPSSPSSSSPIYICRICQETSVIRADVIAPCHCRGSIQWVHRQCLDQWRSSSHSIRNYSTCNICGFTYQLRGKSRFVGALKYMQFYVVVMIHTMLRFCFVFMFLFVNIFIFFTMWIFAIICLNGLFEWIFHAQHFQPPNLSLLVTMVFQGAVAYMMVVTLFQGIEYMIQWYRNPQGSWFMWLVMKLPMVVQLCGLLLLSPLWMLLGFVYLIGRDARLVMRQYESMLVPDPHDNVVEDLAAMDGYVDNTRNDADIEMPHCDLVNQDNFSLMRASPPHSNGINNGQENSESVPLIAATTPRPNAPSSLPNTSGYGSIFNV